MPANSLFYESKKMYMYYQQNICIPLVSINFKRFEYYFLLFPKVKLSNTKLEIEKKNVVDKAEFKKFKRVKMLKYLYLNKQFEFLLKVKVIFPSEMKAEV